MDSGFVPHVLFVVLLPMALLGLVIGGGEGAIVAVHIKGGAKKGKGGGKFYLLFPDSHNVHRASCVGRIGGWIMAGGFVLIVSD